MKKTVSILIALAMLVGVCVGLVSCGDCDHKWGEWSTVSPTCEEYGVKYRKCKECKATETESIDAVGHEGGVICNVCGDLVVEMPNVDTTKWDSIGVVFEDCSFTLETADSALTLIIDFTELYLGVDTNDNLIGYGGCIIYPQTIEDDTEEGVEEITEEGTEEVAESVEAFAYLENTLLYLYSATNTPGEEKVEEYSVIDIAETPEIKELEAYLRQAEEIMAQLEDWYTEYGEGLIAEFAALGEMLPYPEDNSAELSVFLGHFNELFRVINNEDGSQSVVLDLSTVKEWNEVIATENVSTLIDRIFGVGSYATLKIALSNEALYSLSIGVILDYIDSEISPDPEVVNEAIDALLAAIIGEGATLEGLLSEIDPALISEITSYTLMDALQLLLLGEVVVDDPATTEVDEAALADELIMSYIDEIFTALEQTDLYSLIFGADAPMIVETVNEYVDLISDSIGFAINGNEQGAFENAVLTLDLLIPMEDQSIEYHITVTFGEKTVDVVEDMELREDGETSVVINLSAAYRIVFDQKANVPEELIEKMKENSVPLPIE